MASKYQFITSLYESMIHDFIDPSYNGLFACFFGLSHGLFRI